MRSLVVAIVLGLALSFEPFDISDLISIPDFTEPFELEAPSAQCGAALNAWGTWIAGPGALCGLALQFADPLFFQQEYLTYGSNNFGGNLTYFLQSNANCSVNIAMKLGAIRRTCIDSGDLDPSTEVVKQLFGAYLGSAILPVMIPVPGSAPQACLPVFFRFLGAIQSGNFNETDVAEGCNPCTAAVLRAWFQVDKSPANLAKITQVRFICLKRADTWCYFHLLGIQAQGTNATNNLTNYCHPCTYALAGKLEVLAKVNESLIASLPTADQAAATAARVAATIQAKTLRLSLNSLCTKDFNGTYCATKYRANLTDEVLANCGAGVISGNCTTKCRDYLIGVRTGLGCCTGTLLSLMQDQCDIGALQNKSCNVTQQPSIYKQVLTGYCKLTIQPGCGVQQRVLRLKFHFKNLNYGWCKANALACIKFIKDSFVYLASTELVNITVANFNNYVTNATALGLTDLDPADVFVVGNVTAENPAVGWTANQTDGELYPETLFAGAANSDASKTDGSAPIIVTDASTVDNQQPLAAPVDPPLTNTTSSTGKKNSGTTVSPILSLVVLGFAALKML